MNSVDVIFYINLANREDRRVHFLEQISSLTTDMSKVVRIDAVYERIGALGCTKSHIKALEAFIANPVWKLCIVFEDDFTFYNSSQTNNNALLHKFFINFTDWDMLLLASNQRIKPTPTHIPEVNKVNKSQTTSGYLTHKDIVQKILDNFKESAKLLESSGNKPLHALDMYWEKLGLVRYSFAPNMGYQYASVSDVENKHVDYRC